MRPHIFFSSLLITFFSINLIAKESSVPLPNKNMLPSTARIGLVAHKDNGPMAYRSINQLFPPASTLKIVTSLAAKLELGDKFRYSTRLERSGADIILRFSGDPSLTSEHLGKLLSATKMKLIDGDILLDAQAYQGYEHAVGTPWDIVGVCYSTVSSAITVNHNCVQGSLNINDDGSTRIFVPEHQGITVSTTVRVVTPEEQKASMCDLELLTLGNNHYQLSGCVLQRDKPLPLKFALQDTFSYTAHAIKNQLKEKGIRLKGDIKRLDTPRSGTLIAQHYSPYLPDLLEHTLKYSDNLYADNILKTIGAHFYKQPGSFTNGSEAVKKIIRKHTNVDLSRAVIVDGSGLSRTNRLTPNHMFRVLRYIKDNDEQLDFIRLLATSGVDGTLKNRYSMKKEPIKGNIKAKSGSIFATRNMAGFVLDKDQSPKATFVQMITDYHPTSKQWASLRNYEQTFYQNLVEAVQGPMDTEKSTKNQ